MPIATLLTGHLPVNCSPPIQLVPSQYMSICWLVWVFWKVCIFLQKVGDIYVGTVWLCINIVDYISDSNDFIYVPKSESTTGKNCCSCKTKHFEWFEFVNESCLEMQNIYKQYQLLFWNLPKYFGLFMSNCLIPWNEGCVWKAETEEDGLAPSNLGLQELASQVGFISCPLAWMASPA